MQLTRLDIFNPKLLKHDYLTNINIEKVLNTKTSTWLKTGTNEILLIIRKDIIKTPIFTLVPYPDSNKNILIENINDKYFVQNN